MIQEMLRYNKQFVEERQYERFQTSKFPDKKLEGAVHDQIIQWIQEGKLDMGFFVSHRIPFARMNEAFDMIERKEKMLKMVVEF